MTTLSARSLLTRPAADIRYVPIAEPNPPFPPRTTPVVCDYITTLGNVQATAQPVRPTETNRLRLIIINTGTENLFIASGTIGAESTVPSAGSFTALAVGYQREILSVNPVFAYWATTSQTCRVYTEVEA